LIRLNIFVVLIRFPKKTTKELKLKVIDKVNDLNDTYQLTSNQKIAIDIAITQIEKGEFLTNEQSNKEIDEWLNK